MPLEILLSCEPQPAMHTTIPFLDQLADKSPDLFFVYNYTQKRFEYLSAATEALLAYTPDQIRDQPGLLLKRVAASDLEYVLREVKKIKEAEVPQLETEFRLHLPDQSVKWVRIRFYRLDESAGADRHFAGVVEDTTKKKIYDLGQLAIKEQKNIALQVLGHDLRAPLNTISLSMELLDREIDLHQNTKIKELIDIVKKTCRNALDMIKEVLRIEYLEMQEMGIKTSRVDVASRIQGQIDTLRLLDKSNKTFLFQKDTETLLVNTDSVRLMLIIENLLTNAYKFTRPDGLIEILVEDKPESFVVSVRDNGIGIPERLKPLIFDKFTKALRRGIQGEQTVGLGMHLIKTMVEQLRGKIWFESQEGVGTTFFVELPKQ